MPCEPYPTVVHVPDRWRYGGWVYLVGLLDDSSPWSRVVPGYARLDSAEDGPLEVYSRNSAIAIFRAQQCHANAVENTC
jgi:hypothetical protein